MNPYHLLQVDQSQHPYVEILIAMSQLTLHAGVATLIFCPQDQLVGELLFSTVMIFTPELLKSIPKKNSALV